MLFSIGLNLSFPWKVVKSEFRLLDESNIRELHIWIDFEYGSRFISSKGTLLSPHDTVDKQWRHLNFFEHPCYLHARVPRLKTENGGEAPSKPPAAFPPSAVDRKSVV